ncbi:MAG: hypothetical protein LBT20_01705 [Clostridiales bacterium]|jgi:hypothetical protein|nr:hypothetical protein [Clostridiales bacterium]
MKRQWFQMLVIVILIAGMTGTVIVLNKNTKADNEIFIPTKSEEIGSPTPAFDLSGYKKIEVYEYQIPIVERIFETKLYFDVDLSYRDIELDSFALKMGDKIKAGDTIGLKDGVPVVAEQSGQIIFFKDGVVRLKVFAELYADFYQSIYSTSLCKIGDVFGVYLGAQEKTQAEIIWADYLNLSGNYVKFTIKLDNEDLFFLTEESVFLIQYQRKENEKVIKASDIGRNDTAYAILNEVKSFVYVDGETMKSVQVLLGVNFYGYCVIKNVLDGKGASVDFQNGDFYVK